MVGCPPVLVKLLGWDFRGWPRHAAALQRECWPLRRISVAALASLLRPLSMAGWIPADVLYAVDHFPSGRPHLHGEAIRYPRAWRAHRPALWDGHPLHSAERAEAARAARARALGAC